MSKEHKILTPKEISQKYASGHMACTREINHLIKSKLKEQRELCANEIEQESEENRLLYEHTEAIRVLVENAPEPPF